METFRKNPFYSAWDKRALDLWLQFGLRDLPTALYSEYPAEVVSKDSAAATTKPTTEPRLMDEASATNTAAPVPSSLPAPVTLTTTKHQEVFSFQRSAHPAAGQPLAAYTPSRTTHPDMPETNPTTPFYRPEPVITFSQLPFLRPRTFFVFADRSPLSAPLLRNDKLKVTGTGVGGNGGVKAGGTASVTLKDAGHFVCFERVGEVAKILGTELGGAIQKWKVDVMEVERTWEELGSREKFTIGKDREWWTRSVHYGLKSETKAKL